MMNEFGKEQSNQQLHNMIGRNNKIMQHAEQLRLKDIVGAAGLFGAIPMMIGVMKIMVDMVLMVFVFTSSATKVLT